MTARHKLTWAYLKGFLIIAVAAGFCVGSWWVFLGVAILLIGASLHDGSIRPQSRFLLENTQII